MLLWWGVKHLAGRALQREGRYTFINFRVQLKKKLSLAFAGAAVGLYGPPVIDSAPVIRIGDARAATPLVRGL